jgi:hypothetical protein
MIMKAFVKGHQTRFGVSVFLLSIFLAAAASAQPATTTTQSLRQAPTSAIAAPDITKSPTPEDEWRRNIAHKKTPKSGCFQATHPEMEWTEVPCVAPPQKPFSPASGAQPRAVGDAFGDRTAKVRGLISMASGSFDAVAGLSSVAGRNGVHDAYTLQLNTNPFETPLCKTNGCKGWQQFVYYDDGTSGSAFIQYWLVGYGGSTCPAGWMRSDIHCFRNSTWAAAVPHQKIVNLRSLKLIGTANAGGQDVVTMIVVNKAYATSNPGSTLNVANSWTTSEFNIFGDGFSSQANLNQGATLVARTEVESGSTEAPLCINQSFTGETNNTSFSGACAVVGGSYPAIVVTESVGPPTTGAGEIWSYNGTPCDGIFCPGWTKINDNHDTVRIATGATDLFQLQSTGKILKYTGIPCSEICPGWQMLDNKAATVQIAAQANELYQLHNTGRIWRYTGTPCSGNSCPGWQMLDGNPAAIAIAAATSGLYELHYTGKIFKYTGIPCSGTLSCPGWQQIDSNPGTLSIAAAGNNFYQLRNDGGIYKYTGRPCSGTSCPGWQLVSLNPSTVQIAAGDNNLYQLADGGYTFKYTGTPCTGTSCPGWQLVSYSPNALSISAARGNLYEFDNTGLIAKYTGIPCAGLSCAGWQGLDIQAANGRIAASDNGLYKLFGSRIPPSRTRTCYECR